MRVVGLCGGSGSGKGAIAEIFSHQGFLHIDADKVYHRLLLENSALLNALLLEFGEKIIDKDGTVDRKALRDLIFSDKTDKSREKLNKITHKYVIDDIKRIIRESDGKYKAVLVDAPLLFESGFDKECDVIVSVTASENIRIERIIQRDNISRDIAKARIDSQLSDSFLISHSDFLINNNSTFDSLKADCEKIIKTILKTGEKNGRENNG